MARERYLVNAGEDTIHQNEIKLVTGRTSVRIGGITTRSIFWWRF